MSDQADQTLDETLLTIGSTSPFLPGTNIQFAWDSTSLGLIKTCPRLYQYTMVDGWASKDTSVHLRFGIEYHQALQEYDVSRMNGVPHEDAIHDVIRELLIRTADWIVDESTKSGRYKNRRTLLGLVIDYLDHFRDDTCTTYIRSDGTPAVELSFRFELDFGPQTVDGIYQQPYILSGHLDRVVSFNDQLLVMDHKTTTTTPGPYYFAQYEPNNQMTLYTYAGQIILHTPIKGVCISAAQILLTEPNRFVRGFTYRTEDQLNEWMNDLQLTLQIAEQYAQMNYWPMNDTACDKFGGCKFRGICSKSPDVREMFLKTDFIKQAPEDRWNPLRSR